MSEMIKLQETIEQERCRLNHMIAQGINDEAFYEANVHLDWLIEQYIELENYEKNALSLSETVK